MAAPLVKAAIATPGVGRLLRRVVLAVLALCLLPVLLIVAVIAPIHNSQQAQCSDLTGGAGDPVGAEVGALGGISGTGITRAELAAVSAGRSPRVTPGAYVTTSYGPPWGGIQGAGIATAGGLRLNGGAPKKYFVAVDTAQIALGSWVYVWPNPFKWKGAFLAADTGGAINGNRIDFYDWRGRGPQMAWGRTPARVSSKPVTGDALPDDGPLMINVDNPQPVADPACADTGVAIGGSGAGREAVKIAVRFLGKNARATSFAGFQPPSTQDAWCAWFLTNLWRQAGVKIPVSWFSGYPYQWAAQAHPDLIIKRPGIRAKTLKLPVGTALMYGSGPASAATSDHVNMVRAVNPDGTIQLIGGNQDGSRVTTYGPCRLTNGTSVQLSGPGCDPRPIYAIVAPSLDSTSDDGSKDT